MLLTGLLISLGYKLEQELELVADNNLLLLVVLLVLLVLILGIRRVLRD